MAKKIIILSDISEVGSGYKYISLPLAEGLAKLGHQLKIIGLGYKGTEHNYPFSIIPAASFDDCYALANNLFYLWGADLIIVALDVPLQNMFFTRLSQIAMELPDKTLKRMKYIAITPLENGPLSMAWALPLMSMDGIFFISELGTQEAKKIGVTKAEHLLVGVDTVLWHPATKEEKSGLRKGMGIDDDTFVVTTVAMNQERKNLWAAFVAISKLKEQMPNRKIKYILVTNRNSALGWDLQDLSVTLGINNELMLIEQGIPSKNLWGIYSMSDVYLQTSKAEGLGMPVLEAMACKIPVVATDTGALHELLEHTRGILVQSDYSFLDVWGNSQRDMVDIEAVSDGLKLINDSIDIWTDKALEYVKARTWDIPINQVDSKIKEIFNEQ